MSADGMRSEKYHHLHVLLFTIICKIQIMTFKRRPQIGQRGSLSLLSRVMRKPKFCVCMNKGTYQLLINTLVFATRIVQFFFLNPTFQDSSHFRPGRNTEDKFSHDAAPVSSAGEHYTSGEHKAAVTPYSKWTECTFNLSFY